MNTIYTIGYSGRTLQDLQQIATEKKAVIIDVRFMATSRNPDFRGGKMSQFLGSLYRPVRAFGNENYKGGEISLSNPEAGAVVVGNILEKKNVILMCMEADYRGCHRTVVADFLHERFGNPVEHIMPKGKDETHLETSGHQLKLL